MIRALALIACLIPAAAFAQSNSEPPADMGAAHGLMHGQHMMTQGQHMMSGQHMMHGLVANQAGQGAFAAIQEVVEILAADPKTDWSKVNIDALRQHLVDMNNVTLSANVKSEPIDGGVRFDITGDGPVRGSIRRMTMAHAVTMNGVDGWKFEAAEIEGGASLTVHPPAKDADKLHGLGFFGVLTLGMHHQAHHLMIARGENPHELNGVDGWKFQAAEIEGGASLTVHPPAKDADKLHGLGFFGVLTLGMHHQAHHLTIARGENPHE